MDSFLLFAEWPRRTFSRAAAAVGARPPLHLRQISNRDVTPSVCYDDCTENVLIRHKDNAYKIALSYGKTDELCEEGGAFQEAYENCRLCIVDNTGGNDGTIQGYVEPEFSQFIAFCAGRDTPAPRTEPESCGDCPVTTVTNFKGDVLTITLGTESVGEDVSLTRHFTITNTHRVTQYVTPTATTESSLDPSSRPSSDSNEQDRSSSPNIAAIVGSVVPSVVLLLLLAFLGLRWYRRRQRSRTQEPRVEDGEIPKEDKPQLHSDCVARPTYELEGSTPVVLSSPDPNAKAEMAANEPAAHEKSAEKEAAGRTAGRTADNGAENAVESEVKNETENGAKNVSDSSK
ncbi:hypothetical protein ACJZ2D_014713 [Fusarium nematophilum]